MVPRGERTTAFEKSQGAATEKESQVEACPDIKKTLQRSREELTQHLLVKLDAVDHPDGLEDLRAKFEKTFHVLPEVATKIVETYTSLSNKFGLEPGEVSLYMVGGRAKGKPLKRDSDIDLIFGVQNPSLSMEGLQFERFKNDPIDAMDFRIQLMRSVQIEVSNICAEHQISNDFHILNFGTPLRRSGKDTDTSILLASL